MQIKRKKEQGKKKSEEGIALYIAVTITSALVLVAFAIVGLALRQITISNAGRDSQAAFYAADSGSECALYWDVKNPSGVSAFSTTTPTSPISCNGKSITFAPVLDSTLAGTSTISFDYLPSLPYSVVVTIFKGYNGGTPVTKIESKGYNTWDTASPRRVERAIRVTY